MKIVICGSSAFREQMIEYRDQLINLGHEPVVHPDYEAYVRGEKKEIVDRMESGEHAEVKKENGYIKWYYQAIVDSDAILVLNLEKRGQKNYIGGNVLMEMGYAHVHDKKIFLLNGYPEDVSYRDEIKAMADDIINGDLDKINL